MAKKQIIRTKPKKIFTPEEIKLILHHPHLIANMIGKDKSCELHSEWIKYIWLGTGKTSLQAHRGSFKTTNVVIIGAIWFLLFNPEARIGIFRKTFTEASKSLLTIRQIMRMEIIQDLFYAVQGKFPTFTKEADAVVTFNFKTIPTNEGNIEAKGWDYGITGSHYDIIIADDFVTLRDRNSKAEREKAKDVLKELVTNIIDPDKKVGFVGTPWHKNDAWSLCPKPIKYTCYDTKFLSEDQIQQKKDSTTPTLFAANYELKHVADGEKLFKFAKYGRWEYTAPIVVAHVDAAFQGTHTNGFTIYGIDKYKKMHGIGKSYPGNIKDWVEDIVIWLQQYRVQIIYNETNPDKGYTADRLRQLISEYGLDTQVVEYSESMNKHNKIATRLYQYWNDIIWDEDDTDDEYMEQCLDYTKGNEPDDAPDSAASLIQMHFYNENTYTVDNDPLYEVS